LSRPALRLEGVWKKYRVYRERYRSLKEIAVHRRLGSWEDRWVLKDVDFEVQHGETLGLIGGNGAGKSTTLKLMSRILTPERGRVIVDGRLSGLIELGAGFQPEYTGRENIYLNASLLGLTRKQINARLDAIVAFSELEEHIDSQLRTYSSGMQMRLGFAVAIHVEPEILLVDEILAVGDESFQRKCYEWLDGFRRRGGTLVMVSHNLGAIREMCDRAAWIAGGGVAALGPPADVVGEYLDAVRERRVEALGDAARPPGEVPAVELGLVRLLDARGRPAEELRTGDQLSVEIAWHCHRPLETPVFGVALYRNDGAYVYGTNTSVDGFEVAPIHADGTITLTYRSLPLLGGTYLLTVAVFPSPGEHVGAIDYHQQRYQFRLAAGTLEQGLTRLDHDWRLEAGQSRRRRLG
jgi:ABC-type polysaccharide/polyol phosphate transport system ATPase subunit